MGPAEGDEEAHSGDLQREHAGTAAPGLCTQWPHSAPQPPCKCKSCQRSQPSNLGGIWGGDLCPGETCSRHPPLFCTDCYYPLVSTCVVFPMVILKHQQVSWGHDGDTYPCLPHLPCSHLLFLVFFIITIDIPQESEQRFF